jgi:hypothetical protein
MMMRRLLPQACYPRFKAVQLPQAADVFVCTRHAIMLCETVVTGTMIDCALARVHVSNVSHMNPTKLSGDVGCGSHFATIGPHMCRLQRSYECRSL